MQNSRPQVRRSNSMQHRPLGRMAGLAVLVAMMTLVLSQATAIAAPGDITTVAGGWVGDGGQATSAALSRPYDVVVDTPGNLLIADSNYYRIRKVDTTTGVITTAAGSGTSDFSGVGGPATSANLYTPHSVTVDDSGNLFIADTDNDRIRRVDTSTGVITTVAGNGTRGFSGDGSPATSASLNNPTDVAVNASGDLFISDIYNHRVRKVDGGTGVVTTVAGNGTADYSGDGGPATSASLKSPNSVAVDDSGNLFIADKWNHRVREVDGATGVISTVAGNGTSGYSGDGSLATSASLHYPTDLTRHSPYQTAGIQETRHP